RAVVTRLCRRLACSSAASLRAANSSSDGMFAYTSRLMDRNHANLDHIWLPYAQMKTMRPPLAVARTQGCRIVLADGRELIDGVASWWTACHGYNHPHIRQAVER